MMNVSDVASMQIKRIFIALENRGMQQKTFGERIGVSSQIIAAWKNGTSSSYRKYVDKIAQVLGVSANWILTGNDRIVPNDRMLSEFSALFSELEPVCQNYIISEMLRLRRKKDIQI